MKKIVGILLILSMVIGSSVAYSYQSGNIGSKLSYLGDYYAGFCESEIEFINREGETITKTAKNYTQVNWIEKDHEDILQESANLIENNWACVAEEDMVYLPIKNDMIIKYIQ